MEDSERHHSTRRAGGKVAVVENRWRQRRRVNGSAVGSIALKEIDKVYETGFRLS